MEDNAQGEEAGRYMNTVDKTQIEDKFVIIWEHQAEEETEIKKKTYGKIIASIEFIPCRKIEI